MLLLKYLLLLTGWGLLAAVAVNVFKNLYRVVQYHRLLRPIAPGSSSGISSGPEGAPAEPLSTRSALVEKPQLDWTTAKWAFPAAWLPLILAAGIVVVPSRMGGIRVSQTAGTRPGTLSPGVHFIVPLLDSVVLYDTRDQVLTTSSSGKDGLESINEEDASKKSNKADAFTVQSKAGRIRKVAEADAERMKSEAVLLKQNPLLINKIVAERMSDKLQIMMVFSDAKIFFNDVMKSGVTPEAFNNAKAAQAAAEETEGVRQ